MKYQNPLSDEIIQCTVCPRNCKLKNGQKGFCHVRENQNGNIVLNTYGYNTGPAIDPIEKSRFITFIQKVMFFLSEHWAVIWAVCFVKTGIFQNQKKTVKIYSNTRLKKL